MNHALAGAPGATLTRMRNLAKATLRTVLCLAGISLATPAMATIVTFDFTGRLTVVDPSGGVIDGSTDGFTPISAQLTLDTSFTGGGLNVGDLVGTSNLNVTVNDFFLGFPAQIHDMVLSYGGGATLYGNYLADWNGNNNMPGQVTWDVSGMIPAVFFGLQVGDKISGNVMSRDTNNDGIADTVVISNLGSATPYADTLNYSAFPAFTTQGPAPMAATAASVGLTSGPFVGVVGLFDIGSGNSMTVTAISSVPVPAAAWLFGSGLLGLIGVTRRKART